MFNYGTAFSRNIGWVTEAEQQRLRSARVAIAGLGGVGGAHLLTLARMGIANFCLADFDEFGVHNFNRQVGAFMSTVGHSKLEVLSRMARDINPEIKLEVFSEGVTAGNVDRFLDGVDVYVDGIDFFNMVDREMVFAACHKKAIPSLTAAPLGLGVGLLYFCPDAMSFEQYFRLAGLDVQEKYVRFIAGLSPAMLQRTYLVEPIAVNFGKRAGPSMMVACDLCAGLMGSAVMKLVLGRGDLRAAPWALQFDGYRHRLKHTWRPFGNANPVQRLLMTLIRSRLRLDLDQPSAFG